MILPPCCIPPRSSACGFIRGNTGCCDMEGWTCVLPGWKCGPELVSKGWGVRPKQGSLELKGCACRGLSRHVLLVRVSR